MRDVPTLNGGSRKMAVLTWGAGGMLIQPLVTVKVYSGRCLGQGRL
jgi:hypothetical protein